MNLQFEPTTMVEEIQDWIHDLQQNISKCLHGIVLGYFCVTQRDGLLLYNATKQDDVEMRALIEFTMKSSLAQEIGDYLVKRFESTSELLKDNQVWNQMARWISEMGGALAGSIPCHLAAGLPISRKSDFDFWIPMTREDSALAVHKKGFQHWMTVNRPVIFKTLEPHRTIIKGDGEYFAVSEILSVEEFVLHNLRFQIIRVIPSDKIWASAYKETGLSCVDGVVPPPSVRRQAIQIWIQQGFDIVPAKLIYFPQITELWDDEEKKELVTGTVVLEALTEATIENTIPSVTSSFSEYVRVIEGYASLTQYAKEVIASHRQEEKKIRLLKPTEEVSLRYFKLQNRVLKYQERGWVWQNLNPPKLGHPTLSGMVI